MSSGCADATNPIIRCGSRAAKAPDSAAAALAEAPWLAWIMITVDAVGIGYEMIRAMSAVQPGTDAVVRR